jgi:hypothetical protein
MAKKNPAVLWSVDQTRDVIGAEGRQRAQKNIGITDGEGKLIGQSATNSFMTSITLDDSNELKAVFGRPTLANLTPNTDHKNFSIGTNSETGAIEAQDLKNPSSSTDGNGTTYVSSVQQASNGKVSYKTQTITEATDESHSAKKGITTLTSDLYASNTRTTGHTTAVTPDGVWDAIDSLNATDSAVTNQFITSVSESNGIISVTRAQPSLSDLNATTANRSIGTNGSGVIEAQNLTVSTATDGGDSDDLTFVSSVTQASNGKIAVTTKHVPYSIQFIDTSYTYEQVLELITAGKYPVVRYQNGYDTLYLPMFTAPTNSGTDIEFRGFAKNTESSVYKIVCEYETGFGEMTSTAFVSTEDARNFIDNVTYDSATAVNQPGSITLKYHKYNADYNSVLTLRGDLDSGIVIRNVTPAETPAAYKIINQRPVPTYTATQKDRVLTVKTSGDGLEWRALANADWNATSGPSQILNKPTITSIQHKSYGEDPTDVDTLLIDADDPEGYVRVGTSGNTMGLLVEGPYKTLLNSGINDGSGVGDENTPVYIKSDGTFDTCLTRSDVDFILFNYSDPNPQDNVYDAIVAARANNRLPVLYCGMGGSTVYWIFSGEGSIGYSFSRNTSASCSRATIGPDHVFSITEQLIAAGDVVGPSSANNNHIPLYDGTTGKLIKNSKFYFTDEAQADTAEAAKQVKTKAYNDPFRTSQQIVRASQGSGHQDGDFAYWYALNKYRSVAFGISSYGNIKMTEFVQSGSDSVSPSSEQDIITSSGTGNNTVYLFKGIADKASKIDTSSAIGSGDQPVYVAADGTVTACNFQVVIGALPTTTDTIAFL